MNYTGQTIDFRVYGKVGGQRTLIEDVTSRTKPDISLSAEEISNAAGVLGSVKLPILAPEAMTYTLNIRNLGVQHAALMTPDMQEFEDRDVVNASVNGKVQPVSRVVYIKGYFVNRTAGNGEKGGAQDATIEYDVHYYSEFIGGKKTVEIDKENYVYWVNGTDYAEATRNAMK